MLALLLRLRRSLTIKLSVLVTLAVLLVLLLLGIYFDVFLRNNFLDVTSRQMQHAYLRLSDNLGQIEKSLQEAATFTKNDERVLASVELINNYQDKARYNAMLIDEEKKTLALALLDRVKLSGNSEIALYGADEELIAWANQHAQTYQSGYLTFQSGTAQIMHRTDLQNDYVPGQLPALGNTRLRHITLFPAEKANQSNLTSNHRLGNKLVVKNHQTAFNASTGVPIAYIEVSRMLDDAYIARLSHEMDIQLSQSFQTDRTAVALSIDSRADIEQLTAAPTQDKYVGVMQRDTLGGSVFFSVALDKAQHNAVINQHRLRFLLLMLLVAGFILLLMRGLMRLSLVRPLGQLMRQIHDIQQGDYVQKSVVATGDELEEISASVNQLAATVHEREASLQRARDEQEYLSHHDTLTGLPNRRFFFERMEHALALAQRRKSKLAVLFFDLDQFKLVNDTLGHNVGDQLLVQIAQRLSRCVRSSDTLARMGGDEFTLLVEDIHDSTEVEQIVGKYLAQFRQPFSCGSHEINATASMGVAMYPKDATDSLALMRHADLAVYKAKDSGRDNYSFYSNDLSQKASQRADLISALKLAIDTGDQFTLHYQPKVSARSGKVVAAEALLRWHNPACGNVPPLDFIPLAEETGQILAIGDWVIRQGCRDLAWLLKVGVTLNHLSMNVSNVQLRGHNLSTVLQQAITANALQARQIELEITESYIARDLSHAVITLNAFRDLGVQLAIDDFGTGYSSMSYLQKLPFTRIKIDKTFVDGLPGDHDSAAIIRSIVSLAKNFNMAITAEGIERAEQLAFLQQMQCDEVQGYFYARPMPLAEFIDFWKANTAA